MGRVGSRWSSSPICLLSLQGFRLLLILFEAVYQLEGGHDTITDLGPVLATSWRSPGSLKLIGSRFPTIPTCILIPIPLAFLIGKDGEQLGSTTQFDLIWWDWSWFRSLLFSGIKSPPHAWGICKTQVPFQYTLQSAI